MKIVILASLAYSLVNFRGALIAALVAKGHDVVACAPDDDPETERMLAGMGVRYRRIPMDRTGLNPFRDLATLRHLIGLLRDENPDAVLAYTQKPIVYGGIATRLAGNGAHFHAMVSGLGHVYGREGGVQRAMLRVAVSWLYRIAVARAATVFVFNRDDAGEMRRHGILRPDHRVVQVPGSGVDTARFVPHPIPAGPPMFLLIARLMRDKGLMEFVEAARLVRARFPEARFRILGPMDSNPTGIGADEIAAWTRAGDVEYLGETRDVMPHLSAASVFVLPSYYREGLPRTILEAMASGRPVITTDMPGCRDAVTHQSTGFIVPAKDAFALAAAMTRFLEEPDLIGTMGARARQNAEKRFDVAKVNAQLLAEMGLDTNAHPLLRNLARQALGDRSALQLAITVLAALLLLPIMAIIASSVALSLGRPIFFKQSRAGAHGENFDLVKFRTMRDLRDSGGRLLADGARLTLTGRVLRRARLDELPELWNVLRREMNLVGPRPLLPETVAAMGEGGIVRGAVRPGLTGWAQVNGNALLRDVDKLTLDLWYVRNRSLRLDLAILFKTLVVIFRGERINNVNIERGYAGTIDRSR